MSKEEFYFRVGKFVRVERRLQDDDIIIRCFEYFNRRLFCGNGFIIYPRRLNMKEMFWMYGGVAQPANDGSSVTPGAHSINNVTKTKGVAHE